MRIRCFTSAGSAAAADNDDNDEGYFSDATPCSATVAVLIGASFAMTIVTV